MQGIETLKRTAQLHIQQTFYSSFSPRVFVNSIPKSGTNLLKGTLGYLLHHNIYGFTEEKQGKKQVERAIKNSTGKISTAHLFSTERYFEYIT